MTPERQMLRLIQDIINDNVILEYYLQYRPTPYLQMLVDVDYRTLENLYGWAMRPTFDRHFNDIQRIARLVLEGRSGN